MSLCRLFGPHWLMLYFYVPRLSPKITCLYLYLTFKAILVCIRRFWPQTHIHRDVCIKTNIFGDFLIWVRMNWLLSFQMPWECSYSTLHYILGVLYIKPLGYIEGGENESKETIIHFCLNFSYTWVCIPLEHTVFFLRLPFLCELAIEGWRN